MKAPRPIYVEWDDHAHHQGMFEYVQVQALQLVLQQSLGWLVDEDDETLAIAQTIDDLGFYADVLLIDKRTLRRRRYLAAP